MKCPPRANSSLRSTHARARKVPQLEATEEQLAKFPAPQAPAKATEQQPAPAPTATRYPPLESSTR
jgi:outer membrane protein assembly factor BamE